MSAVLAGGKWQTLFLTNGRGRETSRPSTSGTKCAERRGPARIRACSTTRTINPGTRARTLRHQRVDPCSRVIVSRDSRAILASVNLNHVLAGTHGHMTRLDRGRQIRGGCGRIFLVRRSLGSSSSISDGGGSRGNSHDYRPLRLATRTSASRSHAARPFRNDSDSGAQKNQRRALTRDHVRTRLYHSSAEMAATRGPSTPSRRNREPMRGA